MKGAYERFLKRQKLQEKYSNQSQHQTHLYESAADVAFRDVRTPTPTNPGPQQSGVQHNVNMKLGGAYAFKCPDAPEYYRTVYIRHTDTGLRPMISNAVMGVIPPGFTEVSPEAVLKLSKNTNTQNLNGLIYPNNSVKQQYDQWVKGANPYMNNDAADSIDESFNINEDGNVLDDVSAIDMNIAEKNMNIHKRHFDIVEQELKSVAEATQNTTSSLEKAENEKKAYHQSIQAKKNEDDEEKRRAKEREEIKKEVKKELGIKENSTMQMTPQEVALQKKRAMIDQKIALKKKQSLQKSSSDVKNEESVYESSQENSETQRQLYFQRMHQQMQARSDAASDQRRRASERERLKNNLIRKKKKNVREEASDAAKDRHLERGGHAARTDYTKPPETKAVIAGKKPSGDGDAMKKVKADFQSKYGKKALIDTNKD